MDRYTDEPGDDAGPDADDHIAVIASRVPRIRPGASADPVKASEPAAAAETERPQPSRPSARSRFAPLKGKSVFRSKRSDPQSAEAGESDNRDAEKEPTSAKSSRPATRSSQPGGRLRELVRPCRSVIVILGLFSAVVNLLMLTGPLYMLQIYDRVLSSGHVETLVLLTVVAIGALIALGVFDGLRTTVAAKMGSWLAELLAPICLRAEMRRNAHSPNEAPRALGYLGQIQSFLTSPSFSAFFDAPWAPFFIVLVWMMHPWLGMVAVGSAVALFLLSIVNERATRGSYSAASKAQNQARDQVNEMLSAAPELRAMGMERALTAQWWDVYCEAVAGSQAGAVRGGWVIALSKFTRLAVQVAILGVGAILVLRGEITAGTMVASSILLGRALAPVEQAISAWRAFITAREAYGRLGALLETHPEPEKRMLLPQPSGRLSALQVSVADPNRRRLLLTDVSFHLRPGEALAVLGPSGAGKSTLCRLLTGGAARKTGEVRLDGARLESWNPEQLGAAIGYMPQNVRLFSGTVAQNIARFSDAEDEEVVLAAKAARVHDMILSLPDGYDTKIGGVAGGLSGGQQQRIGLARALFGAPPLLILDEPNANLDSDGEAALAQVIREVKAAGAAVLIVGHRPSTIAEVDSILFLNKGVAIDYGPRDDVLGRIRAAQEARAKAPPPPPATPDTSVIEQDGQAKSPARPRKPAAKRKAPARTNGKVAAKTEAEAVTPSETKQPAKRTAKTASKRAVARKSKPKVEDGKALASSGEAATIRDAAPAPSPAPPETVSASENAAKPQKTDKKAPTRRRSRAREAAAEANAKPPQSDPAPQPAVAPPKTAPTTAPTTAPLTAPSAEIAPAPHASPSDRPRDEPQIERASDAGEGSPSEPGGGSRTREDRGDDTGRPVPKYCDNSDRGAAP